MENMNVMNIGTLGDLIKFHREKKEISLDYLSRKTKIRVQQLIKLEENKLSELPNRVYLVGFLKILCNELEINLDLALNFLNEKDEKNEEVLALKPLGHEIKPLPFKFIEKPSHRNFLLAAMLICFFMISGFVGLLKNQDYISQLAKKGANSNVSIIGKKQLVETDDVMPTTAAVPVPVVEPAVAPAAVPTVVPAVIPKVAPTVAPKEEKVALPQVIPQEEVISQETALTQAAVSRESVVAAAVAPLAQVAAAEPLTGALTTTLAEEKVATATQRLTITAKKGTAFLAYRVDQNKLVKIYLQKGKVLELKGEQIRLDVGNPGALEFSKNGEPMTIDNSTKSATVHLVFPEEQLQQNVNNL